MEKDKINETLSVTLGALSFVAIIGLLVKSNFDPNEILSSIINFTQVAIPVLVLLVTTTLKREAKSFQQIGREALVKLQKLNPTRIAGPRYKRKDYDPEKGLGEEYMFIKHHNQRSNQIAKFIPVSPLNQGILIIYVQKGTLVYGLNHTSANATPDRIKEIQTKVNITVSEIINNQFKDFVEQGFDAGSEVDDEIDNIDSKEIEGSKKKVSKAESEIAIRIDFKENEMGKNRFSKAIIVCAQAALDAMAEFKQAGL